jgi:hypothetical protein
MRPSSETQATFAILRQSAAPEAADAIESLVRRGSDRALCRVNVLDFEAKRALDEEQTIAGFLHAARLGLFELTWNVLCPGCGGVLEIGATLKTVNHEEYTCALCAAGYEPTQLFQLLKDTVTRAGGTVRRNCNGLTPFGYYSCAPASGIDRVIGIDMGHKTLPAPDDQMYELRDKVCRYCGHFIGRRIRRTSRGSAQYGRRHTRNNQENK